MKVKHALDREEFISNCIEAATVLWAKMPRANIRTISFEIMCSSGDSLYTHDIGQSQLEVHIMNSIKETQ